MVDCIEREFEAVGDAEFVKNVVEMILHGLLADEESYADFLVSKALGDELTISFSRSLSTAFLRRGSESDVEKALITSAVMRLSSQISPLPHNVSQ